MNVFVLNSGRCGSTTFIRACEAIENYTTGHETRCRLTGPARLAYPPNHIEADNRLCWLLGRLERTFGDNAFYLHLTRERGAVIESFIKRREFGIMKAYQEGILMDDDLTCSAEVIAADYLDSVEGNILAFLKDKSRQMYFPLERAAEYFPRFWEQIGATGDITYALQAFQKRFNASADSPIPLQD